MWTRQLTALYLVATLWSAAATALAQAPAPAGSEPSVPAAPASNDMPDPRPPSGIGGIVVGFGGLAAGLGGLAFIPICYTHAFKSGVQQLGISESSGTCAIGEAFLGLGALVVGAIGLSIGLPRRARYKAWRARQHAWLDGLEVTPNPGGAGLHYRLTL